MISPKLHKGSLHYFNEIIESIEASQDEILMSLYILKPNDTGDRFLKSLMAAAHRGVKVYLLLDAVGSDEIPESLQKTIRQSGIDLHFFNPVRLASLRHVTRRMHQKILIFDRKKAFIGGINISDEYFLREDKSPWLDYAIELRGKRVLDLVSKVSGYFPISIAKRENENLLLQDFWHGENEINRTLKTKMRSAQEEIVLLTPYFFPPRYMMKAIRKARKRGVRVKLILSHHLESGFLNRGIKYYYSFLLLNGVELYEWKETILHAKIILVDKSWACLGSYNLDYLSSFNNIELNYGSSEEKFVKRIVDEVEGLFAKNIIKIDAKEWFKSQTFTSRFGTWLVFRVLTLVRQLIIREDFNRLKKDVEK